MRESSKSFFEDIKEFYGKENREISWAWEDVSKNEDILFYLAFNLSKNVMHGPLPDRLHNRMALESNQFTKAYFNYLGGG